MINQNESDRVCDILHRRNDGSTPCTPYGQKLQPNFYGLFVLGLSLKTIVEGAAIYSNHILKTKDALSLKKYSGSTAEEVAAGGKGIKKKPKPYPIPEEGSFIPIQEDSEEIKYTTIKNIS